MSHVARERSPAPGETPDVVSLSQSELNEALVVRLSGREAEDAPRAVDWAVGDDRVGVPVERLRVSLRPGKLVIELPLVPATGGKALPVATTFPVGRAADEAVLNAAPEERPLGDARLGAQWASVVAEVLWAALLEIGAGRVDERSTPAAPLVLGGVFTDGATLSFAAAARFRELDAIPAPPSRPR